MLVKTYPWLTREISAVLVGLASSFVPLHLFFYKAGPTPLGSSVLADFTPSDYNGAATTTLTFSGGFIQDPAGPVVHLSSIISVFGTDTTTAQNVLGCCLVGDDSVTLMMAERFDTPISVSGYGTGFSAIVQMASGYQEALCKTIILD